ncbi:MAG: DUF4065 domain-containing protein [Brachybacterium sp.]|uniref:Panacea domain-containing protein n=1 Tax=Brachybacterium sp. TaxID=1891286 RepID=UPI002649A54F|nr:type II toxin-antitoxin system antitoxin SocA domain-containing protein [Brachybacterium sp.]MDN5686449.1 DUF4065 domain-containing protein [Brachybacterium sp.]
MSFDPSMISNNILKRAFDEDVPVSPMKLQKILYFAASEYAKRTRGRVLLAEQFQPWKFGPVLQSVYGEFKTYGGQQIRRYAKDAEGRAFIIDEGADPDLASVLDEVWTATRDRTAFNLSQITHAAKSAWWDAWQKSDAYIDDGDLERDSTYTGRLGLPELDG